MNLKLGIDLKKWLPVARKLQPFVFGGLLVGVFGYTAMQVNNALNVKADTTAAATADPASKIKFDKNTIEKVKNLNVVPASVPTGDLGKSDPFN